MKQFIPILGITGLALSGLSAHAQNVFNYTSGDVILDFSQTGSSDFEVDLGSLATLQSEAAANSGTVDLTTVANGYTLSQLSGNFANYNNLSLAVFGATAQTGGSDYFTKKRNNISVQNAAPGDLNTANLNTGASDVLGVVGVGKATGILEYTGNTTANVAEIPTGNVNSYTTIGNNSLNGGAWGTIKNVTATSFSGSIVSDLFEYNGLGSASKAVYEGDFTFNSNGTLDFTVPSVAAPEPGAYGALAGGGLLLLSLGRQLRRQKA